MSEVSATELATRIAIDATELEHRYMTARDALGQAQARADANADHAKLANQNQASQAKALKAASERIEQLEAALTIADRIIKSESRDPLGGLEGAYQRYSEARALTAGGSDPTQARIDELEAEQAEIDRQLRKSVGNPLHQHEMTDAEKQSMDDGLRASVQIVGESGNG